MILVVPKYHDGLADVEKKLTDDKLRSMCDNLDRSGEDEVEVIMPKFELETTTDLKLEFPHPQFLKVVAIGTMLSLTIA